MVLERPAFWAAALCAAALFWLAEHPPMIDLPAHGGQVALLRDILGGDARWTEIVRVNWFTPYLIGYGLALPLSFVMPVAAALKLLLSLACLLFVVLCVRIARHFRSDPRLDWLFISGFFGLPYHWGFFTFLVAAPLTLAFVLAAARYARAPALRAGAGVFVLGAAMLAAHGLAFVIGWTMGATLLLGELRRAPLRRLLTAGLPFAGLALACMAYFVASRFTEAGYRQDVLNWMDLDLARLLKVPLFALGERDDKFFLVPVAYVLLATPFLMGLRMRRDNWRAMVPLGIVLLFTFTLPSVLLSTSLFYERFALFLLPAWAWAFPAPARAAAGGIAKAAQLLAVFIPVALLALYGARTWRFGQETRAIDAAVRALEPGERALGLAFDPGSRTAANARVYVHYASWYQAERHGFVDFNFAWFPPQIVRFRPGEVPAVRPGFEWLPERFQWQRHEGWRYRYFLVHGAVPPYLFHDAPCEPVRLFSDGRFAIYENRGCGEG